MTGRRVRNMNMYEFKFYADYINILTTHKCRRGLVMSQPILSSLTHPVGIINTDGASWDITVLL